VAKDERFDGLGQAFFVWGIAWWFAGLGVEFYRVLPAKEAANAFLASYAATMLAFAYGNHRGSPWREGEKLSDVMSLVLWLALIFPEYSPATTNPLSGYGWLAFPFAIGAHYRARRWIEGDAPAEGGAAYVHTAVMLLVALIGAGELRWITLTVGELRHTAWSAASFIVVPALLVLAVSAGPLARKWPVVPNTRAYRLLGSVPILGVLVLWMVFANLTKPGSSAPLPYLPLLNAIDLGHALIAITFYTWWKAERPAWIEPRTAWGLAGALAFLWANSVLLRSLYHWAGVDYHLGAWLRSTITQASISVFWSALALGLMLWATRKARRPEWMVGAILMGVVVAKLALVDFAALSGLPRILSFIGVGVLMLVIGYFAPVPPKRKEEA